MTAIPARLSDALSDRYRILRELGAGGMATVYLAEDIRHHRRVALKVLRPELAAVIGAERFLKEIETTANLQHPHILPLFDSGTVDGTVFYVMPYVEGESLRERIIREKQLPVADAVRISREVASALDYAHRKGIVHRDIKPENILLHDGQALVADFGIALAASTTGGTRMTETGMSLGTPHYMSPEQAMGERALDARSDVYALGCVLYEMLSGEPPFNGPTAQAIVARVMTDTPRPLRQSRPAVPAHIEAAVTTALQKLPADRFATAAEFSTALATTGYTTPGSPIVAGRNATAGTRRLPWIVAGMALLLAAVAGAALLRQPAPADAPVVRTVIRLPDSVYLTHVSPTLSRDGTRLVIQAHDRGTNRLLTRRMDGTEFTPVAASDDVETSYFPFFSPDSRWLMFSTQARQMKVLADGGGTTNVGERKWDGDWAADGTIYFPMAYNTGLFRMSDDGTDIEQLSAPDTARQELGHWHPQLLPGGRHLLFTAFSTPITNARIEVLDLASGKRTVLAEGAIFGRYVATGHLLFARGTTVFAAPMSLKPLRLTGPPVPVIEDVAEQAVEGRSAFAVSDDGTLVHVRASHYASVSRLMWHDRSGRRAPVAGAPPNAHHPALSPDGARLAYSFNDDGVDVWVLDLARGSRTRLTAGGGADFGPSWSADGRSVLFVSERPAFDLYQRAADASSPVRPLVISSRDKTTPYAVRGHRDLVFSETVDGQGAIRRYDPASGDSARTVLSGSASYRHPQLSPDGRWLAYASNESGQIEIYVVPYPEVAARRLQVSSNGGIEPQWTRNGTEIVFRSGTSFMAVPFNPATGQMGTAAELFRHDRVPSIGGIGALSYAVTPDGQRFIMAVREPGTEPREIVVVANWFRELREKMAGR